MVRRLLVLALPAAVVWAGCTGGDGTRTRARPPPRPAATARSAAPSPTATTQPSLDNPDALKAELAAVEVTLRDPATVTERVPALARRQLLAYRALAHHREWRALVIGHLPQELRAAADANLTAQLELEALTPPRTDVPAWTVRPPLPAAELLAYYREAETATGVPWAYLAAVHLIESRLGRIHSPSTAGALGPMQFLPATWAEYGTGDIQSDHDAIQAAARYLHANGAPADMSRALFRYNRSDHYVRAVTAYAEVLLARPAAFDAYYHWPVLVRLVTGDVILEEGRG